MGFLGSPTPASGLIVVSAFEEEKGKFWAHDSGPGLCHHCQLFGTFLELSKSLGPGAARTEGAL